MTKGLTARVGSWCFRYRWIVLGLWVAAVVAGGLSATPVFEGLSSSNGPSSLESIKAYDVLNASSDEGGTIIGLVDRVDPLATALRAPVLAAARDLSAIPGVHQVSTPYDQGIPRPVAASMIARDGRGLLIRVTLADLDSAGKRTATDAVSSRLRELRPALTSAGARDARVLLGGTTVLNSQANQMARQDLSRAEAISLPITLVVLVIVFGGLIAAGLPVISAAVSVASVMGVLLAFSTVIDLNTNAVTVVTLLGLGLSVDYGLLLVARYREELGAGCTPELAVGRAWATAGRTIMFSALTVAAALTGLLMFGFTALSALGAAGLSIAVVGMLASLTLTAALLGFARRWIRPSKRAARRAERFGRDAEVGFFARLSRLVQRRPVVTVLATGAALVAAGTPLLSMVIHLPGLDSLPSSMESVQVAQALPTRFGQASSPAVTVVARTNPGELDAWAARWRGADQVMRVAPAKQVGPGLSTVDIDVSGDPQGAPARALVDRVRADRPAGVESWVTGNAAVLDDLLGLIESRLPLAVGTTLLAMIVLLFAMTGSLVVPLKAIVMNVVSLGASFGVLDAVFEHGFLAGPLHILTVAGIDPFVIVVIFAFAFGLSMDYEVFLLSRIKEYVDRGMDTDAAVRHGLQRSGKIITSAALLMLIVFGCFAAARIGTIQQIGLGLAVAVAIDATIVRCVLVPATMTLLGRWNWWAPRWMKRVHARVGLTEHALPPAPSATDAGVSAEPEPAAR